MVRGFKDSEGVFHPIGSYHGGKRKSQSHRYANDVGLSLLLEKSVKNFATKRKEQYKNFKAKQQAEFQEEISMRRRFSGKLITAFRLARAQGITNPRQLEKFIRAQVPDLPSGKKTNKFVEKVLREFVKQEKEFNKKIQGKSEAEKQLLQDAFDNSIKESETRFATIQKEIDEKFEAEQKKQKKEFDEKIEKLKKEEKEKSEAEQRAKQAEEELAKKEKELQKEKDKNEKAKLEAEVKKAENKVEQTEKVAEKEKKDEVTFANEVMAELDKDSKQSSPQDFSFGFPTDIV